MKQSEKLDLLLRGYYEKRNTYLYYFPEQILKEFNIPFSDIREATSLGKRLHSDKFLTARSISNMRIWGRISSEGIDYCEGDSYTNKGFAIITNDYSTVINNSQGVSVVNSSENFTVNISNLIDIEKRITDLVELIKNSEIPSEVEKNNMLECIDEIKTSLQNDKKPKYAFQALLGMTNNFAGIGSLAIEIGKLIF